MTLPFPFRITYRRKIKFKSFNEEQIRFLKKKLESKSVKVISSSDAQITFQVPYWRFVWSWNIMNPVDKGQIKIQRSKNKNEIIYEVSFVRMIIILIIMGSFMTLFDMMALNSNKSSVVYIFSLLIGLNIIIGWIRQELFFIDLVDEIKLITTKAKKHNNAF